MTSDLNLLRQFARENSQDAFGEIVRRHLDLVYSTALRQVRSPELAEDVAQSVFAALARDAHKLKPDTILTAWLYTVARRTAIDAIRKESRRQLREQTAREMNVMNATADDWTHIAPLLDDAMAALDETDRAAILLRFFENKNLRDVGTHLKISDDAAQKRVSRAVERLRECLSKERVTIGAAAILVLISANAVHAAPAGLAATILKTTLITTPAAGMTMIHKILISGMTAATVFTGLYALHLQTQVKSLLGEEASLKSQTAQLQHQLADATNQMEALQEQNEQSQADQQELLRLRGEVTRLGNQPHFTTTGLLPPTNNPPSRLEILIKSKFAFVPVEDVPALGVEWTSSQPGSQTGLLSQAQFNTLMAALQAASDVHVLSSPRALTLSGMESTFSVTRPAPVGGTNANVGEQLAVTPYYSTNSSEFNLNLNATLNVLTGDPAQPDFQSIQITNQLSLSPGQTVVFETAVPPGTWVGEATNIPAGAQSLLVFVTPSVQDPGKFPVSQ